VPDVAKPKGAAKKAAKIAKPSVRPKAGTAKAATKSPAKKVQPTVPPTLPTVAVKPKKATAPSIPLPPPPPPPPAHRDELIAPRDIGRLLRYGEPFGPHRIDVRMLPTQLPAASGVLAVMDPLVAKSWRAFDRPVAPGAFRVMLSVAKTSDKGGSKERLAAVVIHVGRPPIAKWVVAHYAKQKRPKSADDLPRVEVSGDFVALIDAGSGSPGVLAVPASTGVGPIEVPLTDGARALAFASGDGSYAAYWGVDAEDKAVCLVLDFDVFTQKDWKAKPAT